MTAESYELRASERFVRRAKKFLKKHPDLRGRFEQILRDLKTDPFQPHLGLHQLKGDLRKLHAVRVTYSYRITLTLYVDERSITLIDIGAHDEVYR